MASRNPDESKEPVQDALTDETRLTAAQAKKASTVTELKDPGQETKAELDRVELYLKGPTVFSA